jgi:hypothetical protein
MSVTASPRHPGMCYIERNAISSYSTVYKRGRAYIVMMNERKLPIEQANIDRMELHAFKLIVDRKQKLGN